MLLDLAAVRLKDVEAIAAQLQSLCRDERHRRGRLGRLERVPWCLLDDALDGLANPLDLEEVGVACEERPVLAYAGDGPSPRARIQRASWAALEIEFVPRRLHPLHEIAILSRKLVPCFVHIGSRSSRHQLHCVLLQVQLVHHVCLDGVTIGLHVLRLAEQLP